MANSPPMLNSTRATTKLQKKRSRPNPKGCSGVASRRARLPPRKSRPWLPVSARECTPSARRLAEPVMKAPANLTRAMPRLARKAATIALRLPSCIPSHAQCEPAIEDVGLAEHLGAAVAGAQPAVEHQQQ